MSNTVTDRTSTEPLVTAATVSRHLEKNAPLRILDVRTPGEFQSGHIPGAKNVPLDQLGDYMTRLAPHCSDMMVVVCQAGGRAATAHKQLSDVGATGHKVLDGGMNAWNTSGGQVESAEARWVLERQVRLVAGSLVLTGIVASVKWPAARFFSAMTGGGLVYAAMSNTCVMGSVLGKLPYNRGRKQDIEEAVAHLSA